MKTKVLITILLCIGLMLCFISCSDEDTGVDSDKPTQSSAPSVGEGEPSDDVDKKEYHTVTFITNNGTVIEPVQVEDGRKIAHPQALEKAGYTFDGWYLGEEKWSFAGYIVTEDITLTAKWVGNENKLVFDGNGATGGVMMAMTISTDASANLTFNKFTKAGYTFMGWSTTPDGEVEYTDGAEYTMGAEASYTLYAVWEINANGLFFDGTGGDGDMTRVLANTNEKITLPKNSFIKAGYTFMGWSTTPDELVEYTDGAEYIMGTKSSYTLYAVWDAITYTVKFEANGGKTEKDSIEFTVEDLPLTFFNAYKTDYTFVGWYEKENLSGTPITELTTAGNITLYAKYEYGTEGIVYVEKGGLYEVSGYLGYEADVIIPSSHNGKSVTSIGEEAFYYHTILTSVVIPNSVTSIGGNAFEGCLSLTSVIIPNSVMSIGNAAFYYCDSLESVVIGDNVTSIGNEAFRSCRSLESVIIPANVAFIGENAFRSCTHLTSVTFKRTSGWYVTQATGATSGTNISTSDLSNVSTAAEHLTITYYNCYWYRK